MMNLLQYVLIAFEAVGFVYFFDSFFDTKIRTWKWTLYPLVYVQIFASIFLASLTFPKYGDLGKILLIIVALYFDCIVYYGTSRVVGLFFSGLNYILLFFVDAAAVSLIGLDETLENYVLCIGLRLIWILMLSILRRNLKPIREYLREDRIPWTRFAWLPLFSGIVGIYFYIFFLSDAGWSLFYSFVSIGLLCLNIISLLFMQDSLLKEERLRRSEIQIQKKENQLQMFHDMQSLYEQQGRKVHDYKKQLSSIQELLERKENEAAIGLVRGLTESISAEMSEINTGHPIVNAVLNQAYRMAKGKGIGMVFSIGNMQGMQMEDEDIVVLFGNLLENAIHECERLLEKQATGIAIQVKLGMEDEMVLFAVQNPVTARVEIEGNRIIKEAGDGHGIGLYNVREVVRRYNGNFAISCDDKEFTATVLI